MFGSVLGLLTSAYLGRRLGVSGFGVLSLGRTILDYILLPLGLGITAVGFPRDAAAAADHKRVIAGDVVLSVRSWRVSRQWVCSSLRSRSRILR